MSKKEYPYKTLKIYESTHGKLSELAAKDGLPLINYMENLVTILSKDKINLSSLRELAAGGFGELTEKMMNGFDRLIKIVKAQEKEVLIPTRKNTFETLNLTEHIVQQIEFVNSQSDIPEQQSDTHLEQQPVVQQYQSSVSDNQVKIEKERLEIKNKQLLETLQNLISEKKLVKSPIGSSYTRKISEQELNEIKILIESCTAK